MICGSRKVFRCFKALERLADRLTGAAGPYFVGLAVILIGMGTICFFDIIAPSLSYPIISLPVCLVIALNLVMHYFYVCTVPPGFAEDKSSEPGSGTLWARRKKRGLADGVRWSQEVNLTKAEVTQCSKCGQTKPERTHHCRVCNRCVLKYDHHCPCALFWINQCVGLHNERHFVLFMAYLVLSTFCLSILGYSQAFEALGITYTPWSYHVPEIMYILIYLLSAVLCLAVGIMLSYHLWGVACGETSVESQDHEIYRGRAKSRGETFVNSYDLGKLANLQLFFNVGETGYPLYTLVLPLRINPYTNGRSWARRTGYDRHVGVRRGEELTDDEGDDELE